MKQNNHQKTAKNAKDKLPAGTPASAATDEGYGPDKTQDPAVPNRAHTEMKKK